MGLTFRIHPERDLTIFLAEGEVSLADVLQAYREAKDNHGLTKHTIWDARAATFKNFSNFEMDQLDQFLALIQDRDKSRLGGRSALLFSCEEDAAVFQSLLRYSYRLPQRRKIVFTLEDAYAWILDGA
jgi:hypothetical protein